jgi:crossover junction endodeoxyribonuclease RuvC
MKVLGIDPGIATTGYSIVEKKNGGFELIESGIIQTKKRESFPERLLFIYRRLLGLIERFQPEAVAIEEIYFCRNTKTALKVGEARGIAVLSAASNNLPVYGYTPLQIKQAVCGFGRATKEQVQKMIKRLLNTPFSIEQNDAADAVACAICHLQWKSMSC